jgi:YD repeat-containing protein
MPSRKATSRRDILLSSPTLWATLGGACLLAASAGATLPEPGDLLPEAADHPHVERPSPQPGDLTRGSGGIRFAHKNRVHDFVNVDPSPRGWAGHVLRIDIGFEEPWRPARPFALFPKGSKTFPDRAVAFLGRRLVLFDEPFDISRDDELYSKNRSNFTLSAQGQNLVVRRGAEWAWRFSSAGSTEGWRLESLGRPQRPSHFTRLQYTNGRLTSVHYPNGEKAELELSQGRPVKIELPFRRRVHIERKASGYVTRVRVRQLDEAGKAEGTLRDLHYERDAKGRITRWGGPHDVERVVTHSRKEVLREGKKEKHHTSRIRAPGADVFRYRRHIVRDGGNVWILRTGYGEKADDGASPQHHAQQRARLEKVGGAHELVAVGRPDSEKMTRYEIGHRGRQRKQILPNGREIRLRYNRRGQVVLRDVSEGGREKTIYNDWGQLTRRVDGSGAETRWKYGENRRLMRILGPDGSVTQYEYGEDGFLEKTVRDGKAHRFHVDRWGRITSHERPDGSRTKWKRNAHGHITHRERGEAADFEGNEGEKQDEETDLRVTRYFYDEKGRLKRIRRSGEAEQRFVYGGPGGRLSQRQGPGDRRVLFEYDGRGRLVRRVVPGQRLETWSYYDFGVVKRHTRRDLEEGGRLIERFDRTGKRIERKESGEGDRAARGGPSADSRPDAERTSADGPSVDPRHDGGEDT